jgi:hypothetical protein
MSKHDRIIARYRVTNHPDFNELRIKLSYDIGGMNYFTAKSESRGLYLHSTPLMVNDGSETGYRSTIYRGFSGVKKFVKEMSRFSAKTLNTFEISQEDYDQVKNWVINKHGLKLEKLELCK